MNDDLDGNQRYGGDPNAVPFPFVSAMVRKINTMHKHINALNRARDSLISDIEDPAMRNHALAAWAAMLRSVLELNVDDPDEEEGS